MTRCPQLSHLQFAICAELWAKPGKTHDELVVAMSSVIPQERLEKMLIMLIGYELVVANGDRLVLAAKALPLVREFQMFITHYNKVIGS